MAFIVTATSAPPRASRASVAADVSGARATPGRPHNRRCGGARLGGNESGDNAAASVASAPLSVGASAFTPRSFPLASSACSRGRSRLRRGGSGAGGSRRRAKRAAPLTATTSSPSASPPSPPQTPREEAARAPAVDWDRQAWVDTYSNMTSEDSYVLDAADVEEGALPPDLVGTLYRNGPAKFNVGPDLLKHPWEGDGAIAAMTFYGDGTVWFRNRFVRTAGFLRELRAGRQMYRGTFGTPRPGGIAANCFDLRQKNLANTHVVRFGGQLLALYEGGLPHKLAPDTLRTQGAVRLGENVLPRNGAFTAHPHVDPQRRRLVGFASNLGLSWSSLTSKVLPPPLANLARSNAGGGGGGAGIQMRLRFLEFDEGDFRKASERAVHIDGFGFFHDFAVTQRYYILLQAPLEFDPLPFVAGLKCAGESIRFRGDVPGARSKLILIPRESTDNDANDGGAGATTRKNRGVRVIETDPCSVFHFANAFDADSDGSGPDTGEVVVDCCRLDTLYVGNPSAHSRENGLMLNSIDFERDVPKSSLWRCRIDVTRGRASWHELHPRYVDFPAIHPRCVTLPHRYVWLSCSDDARGERMSPTRGVTKLDLRRAPPSDRVGRGGNGDNGVAATDDERDQVRVATWMPPAPYEFAGEPVFVPAAADDAEHRASPSDEDNGYILVVVHDGRHRSSYLAVLSARDLTLVCRLRLRTFLPAGLHGSFTPEVFDVREHGGRSAQEIFAQHRWNTVDSTFRELGVHYE